MTPSAAPDASVGASVGAPQIGSSVSDSFSEIRTVAGDPDPIRIYARCGPDTQEIRRPIHGMTRRSMPVRAVKTRWRFGSDTASFQILDGWFPLCRCSLRPYASRIAGASSYSILGSASERSSTSKGRNHSNSEVSNNSGSSGSAEDCGSTLDERAARRIQTAYRGFRARRALCRLKGLKRLKVLGQGDSIQKQASTTLSYLQSWSKIQAEIRARRISMVTEGRIKQKKQENQIKLEARLHDIEVDWCCGSETMEEILSRVQQREEAAVKRERAMAYAFAHQWRANSGQGQPQEGADEAASKAEKKTNSNPSRVSTPVKTAAANGKSSVKIMLPKPIDEKAVPQAANKTKMKQEEHHSTPTNRRYFCLSSTR